MIKTYFEIVNGDRDCHCDVGFTGNGRQNCSDIDECKTLHINCGAGTCVNTVRVVITACDIHYHKNQLNLH